MYIANITNSCGLSFKYGLLYKEPVMYYTNVSLGGYLQLGVSAICISFLKNYIRQDWLSAILSHKLRCTDLYALREKRQ